MPKIKINPDEIDKVAGKIDRISQRLSKLAREATSIGLSAPSYDGQLKPRVISLANQMNSQVMQGSARSLQGSRELKSVSKKFWDADRLSFLSEGVSFERWKRGFFSWAKDPSIINYLMLGALSYVGISGAKQSIIDIPRRIISNHWTWVFKRNITREEAIQETAEEMRRFKRTITGREMIKKANESNIAFVLLDDKGNELERIGRYDATNVIPIKWVSVNDDEDMKGNAGFYRPSDNTVYLNEDYRGWTGIAVGTLIHEMQHAIDFNGSPKPVFLPESASMLANERSSEQTLSSAEIALLEKEYANMWEFYVDSEIKAHDIGYIHGGNLKETFRGIFTLDRSDGVNTRSEKLFILETRHYAINSYEKFMNDDLIKMFPNGPKYSSKVYLDDEGNIKVKIFLTESSGGDGGGGGGGAW